MDYRDRWELKDYLIGRTLERRIALFRFGVLLMLLAFLFNFWYLQAMQAEEYAALAENNRLRRIPSLPTRGVLVDRQAAALASTRPSLDLILMREGSRDVDAELRRLELVLGVGYEELLERVARGASRPAYEPLVIGEDLTLEELAKIEARREQFPSLQVRQTARRSYVHDDLLAHVIGYVGEVSERRIASGASLKLGDIVGKTGLERGYDEWLRGERGWDLVSVNNIGRRIGDPWVGQEPTHGRPLELTLDLRLQRELRAGLGDEMGAGVFMDPRTGEVLALVSTPTFDPNSFVDGLTAEDWRAISEDPRRPLHDRAIASFYAPGSVYKVLMAIVGLETGTVTPAHTVHCGGSTTVYRHKRLCWKRGGHGTVDLEKALAHSCNVYFYHLGKDLGIDPIEEYSAIFNLGRPTGIDLPGEARGVPPSKAWKRKQVGEPWYPGDTISVAIGQGYLAVTPVQMATMMSAVAADGWLPTPRLVRSAETERRKLGLQPETIRIVKRALRRAVQSGTGRSSDVEGFPVAGKTGTAQVYKHSAGIDSDELPKPERDHAWFVGYAPADDPQIAFAIVVEHGGHGGSSAAPIAKRVLEVFFKGDATPEQQAKGEVTGATAPAAG